MLGRVVCGSRTWMCTMAAPALAASIADTAISRGVTGTAGLRAGVSADPVTAQAIITLRCIIHLQGRSPPVSLAANRPERIMLRILGVPPNVSFDAQMRVAHHLAPLHDLALDARAKLLRFVRHWLETELEQVFLDIRLGHRLSDLALQQINDLLRRSRRRQYAGKGIGLLVRVAGFSHGRYVGDFRAALAVVEVAGSAAIPDVPT